MSLLSAKQTKSQIDPTLAFLGKEFAIFPELERNVGCGFGRVGSSIVATIVRVTGFVLFPCIRVVRTLVGRTLVLCGAVAGRIVGITGGPLVGTDRIEFLPFPVTAVYLQGEVAKLSQAPVPRKME